MTVLQGLTITVQDELRGGHRADTSYQALDLKLLKVVGNAGSGQFTGTVSSFSCTKQAGVRPLQPTQKTASDFSETAFDLR